MSLTCSQLGLLAQLERCSCIVGVKGTNSIQAWKFFLAQPGPQDVQGSKSGNPGIEVVSGFLFATEKASSFSWIYSPLFLCMFFIFSLLHHHLPNWWKFCFLRLNPSDSNSFPWKSSLKKIFEPFFTKLAGILITILTVGALLVAKATAIKVTNKKAVRAEKKLEVWGRGLPGRGRFGEWPCLSVE